jgi:TATA-box binding protein (TBP) (component of TFIID and TFIIIB)
MTTQTPIATPYRVSTITCNGSIGKQVGEVYLNKLYEHIPIVPLTSEERGFVYVIDKDGREFKGILPKRQKKYQRIPVTPEEQYKKRRFDNAISGYFKLAPGYCPSVKIFKNGTVQMTGVRSIPDGNLLNECVFEVVKKIADKVVEINNLELGKFYVRLINSDFTVSYNIRRKELHHILVSPLYGNTSSFQPGTYPGVKLQYFWNQGDNHGVCTCTNKCFGKGQLPGECKKITVSIFESGKVLITGAIEFHQIDEAYAYICNILQKHRLALEKIPLLVAAD